MKFGTKLIHNGNTIDVKTGALSVPIYQVSTFHQKDVDLVQEYEYSRSGNPTRKALEDTIAKLESGNFGFAFATGMAAVSSVLSIFSAGDHLVVCEDVYGGTYRYTTTFLNRFGIEVSFVDASNNDDIAKAIKSNTKAIYLETPSNPLIKITDLIGVVKIAKERNLLTIIDNTFMTPYLQRPLELGIDIIIHSGTKFLNGHSDVVAGLVVVKDEDLAKRIYQVQNGFGAVLGPQDSWLLLRGMKTLKIRMDYQQKSAGEMAKWLQSSEFVEKVYYPGLLEHPGRDIHFAQSSGAGAVLSFETKTVEQAKRFMKKITLAAVAVSLGGVETIVSYPVTMSHAAIPREKRVELGISDRLMRVSLGLEEMEDLIEDFGNALKY